MKSTDYGGNELEPGRTGYAECDRHGYRLEVESHLRSRGKVLVMTPVGFSRGLDGSLIETWAVGNWRGDQYRRVEHEGRHWWEPWLRRGEREFAQSLNGRLLVPERTRIA